MAFPEFKSRRLEKGLSLEERPRAATYAAAARLNGTVHRWNTETADLERAERLARSWFSRLKADYIPGSREHVTMMEAAKAYIRSIRTNSPEQTAAKKAYHQQKWDAISDFFRAVDVDAVDTKTLKRFMQWEKREHVKPITLRKDFVTIRLILRNAVDEQWISAMPVFPKVGSIEKTVQPWFENDQWALLLEQAEERIEIAKDEAGNHRHKRMDLLDFMKLQVATCLRVDELRCVRVRDVKILRSKRVTYGGQTLPPTLRTFVKDRKPDTNEYLELQVRTGTGRKTGARTALTRVSDSGVETFRSLVKRKTLKPDDLLFEAHCRDAFRELLIDPKVNLRMNNGMKRNLKSLRPTGMMRWILDMPHANLKLLAQSWGTSVEMIDKYYLQPLGVKLSRDAIVG